MGQLGAALDVIGPWAELTPLRGDQITRWPDPVGCAEMKLGGAAPQDATGCVAGQPGVGASELVTLTKNALSAL